MKYSIQDVERLAGLADKPCLAITKPNDGCGAILQGLANRPDEWQPLDSLNAGTLLDVERLILGTEVLFSQNETGEPRATSDGCQCSAKYLPDGRMAWIRPDGDPCDCKPSATGKVVPIASIRITSIGAELLETVATPSRASKAPKPVKTQKTWTGSEVNERIRLELASGDAATEQEALFASADELAVRIGCDRKTVMRTTFWVNDRIEKQKAWRRKNSPEKRTRKRDI